MLACLLFMLNALCEGEKCHFILSIFGTCRDFIFITDLSLSISERRKLEAEEGVGNDVN